MGEEQRSESPLPNSPEMSVTVSVKVQRSIKIAAL